MPAERASSIGLAGAPPAALAPPRAALGRTVVSIQFLRFLAALAVVLYHAYEAASRGLASPPAALDYLFRMGAAGVHIFFCISGFVMVYTSFCRDVGPFTSGDFLLKRGLRIYPIYWLCAGAYLLFHFVTRSVYPVSGGEVLGALALVPGYASAIIGPAWTLMFEVYFYLCFCVFMVAGLRTGLIAMTGFFLLCMVLRVVAPGVPLHPIMTNSLLLEFAAGAWLGWVAIARPAWLAAIWPAALLLGVAAFAGGYAFGYNRLPSAFVWGFPSLLVLIGAVGMEAAGRMPRAFARLAFLGDGSYFLYLSHILLIDMLLLTPLAWLCGSTVGVVTAALLAAAICAALSVPAYNHLERPMLRHLRRLTRRRSTAVPPGRG